MVASRKDRMKRAAIGVALLLALLAIGAAPAARGWRYSVVTEV
jgi:hypothetical protein